MLIIGNTKDIILFGVCIESSCKLPTAFCTGKGGSSTDNQLVYIHGKGGSASEADLYAPIFPEDKVLGFDYKSETPWDAQEEFRSYFDNLPSVCGETILIANSIGAYYALCSLSQKCVHKACFISPIVNMEQLILDMMRWANVTESELAERKRIPTTFGEPLSWEYLSWVRNHPVAWNVPTAILYGEKDNLQSAETIRAYANHTGSSLTVMENGEHWFHTPEQMQFLYKWIGGAIYGK